MTEEQLAATIRKALAARDQARRRVPFRRQLADNLFVAAVMHAVGEHVAAQKPAPRKRPATRKGAAS